MKIGITERGDAGLDISWAKQEDKVDGVILVTKNITLPRFSEALRDWKKPAVLHCTVTGMAGTALEPNVPCAEDNMDALAELLKDGVIKRENVVFRIDPIYPYDLKYARAAIETICRYWQGDDILQKCRFRVSVMDFYPHVRERLSAIGIYHEGKFTASDRYFDGITKFLESYPGFTFGTCAEEKLHGKNIAASGCVSEEDIKRMGLDTDREYFRNPQNRNGCLCLSCKKELLTSRSRCQHQCAYCYWK